MSTLELNRTHTDDSWYQRFPWLILVAGTLLALAVTAVLFLILMRPPSSEMRALISTLALTSVLSLGLGYLFYRRGWARSTSLMRTLVVSYIWGALLTLFNVGIMQQQMFVSEHDLLLSGVLLLFAALIATTFGLFVSASVTDDLRQLSTTAEQLAEGDLSARVTLSGRDEVAQLGQTFNAMASQLQEVDQQRTELEELRRDLIAWASHDLRTPLTSIRVRVEALNDGVVDDVQTQQRYYESILSDVLALNYLLDDMLELAQLDNAQLAIETAPDSLIELIHDSVERFQILADEREVALRADIGPDIDPVRLNAGKIARVLDNLISNALRYAPPESSVLIGVQRDHEGVTVSVADSGPGFNEVDLPRLFEQFYRGEQARTRATGGAGLGLAIARGVVEAHGGQIWAENRPEGGALVAFRLPA